MTAVPPRIPPSARFNDSYIEIISTTNLVASGYIIGGINAIPSGLTSGISDGVMKSTSGVMTGVTIIGETNNVSANSLKTTGEPVNISSSDPPTIGQILVATSPTTATWQTGTGSSPADPTGSIQFNNAGTFGGNAGLTTDGTNLISSGDITSGGIVTAQTGLNVMTGDILAVTGNVVGQIVGCQNVHAQNEIIVSGGNVNILTGNINVDAGNINVQVGNITTGSYITAGGSITSGDYITATSGDISATNGHLYASGNIVAQTGYITAGGSITSGDYINATNGDISATNGSLNASGNVIAQTGYITAGGYITSGDYITATSGDISAINGEVYASGNVVAGANLNSSTGGDIGSGENSIINIGSGINSLIGLYGVTAIVRPDNSIAAASFVANTSGIVDDSATFGGYTIGQIVQALVDLGVLT